MESKRPSFKQIGGSGLTRYSGYVYEEFLPSLRWPQAHKIYTEMADNDPVIGSVLYLAEMLIRNISWTVKHESESKEDKEAAKFLESCMHDMENSWEDTVSEILSMLQYGFSFHEVVCKVRKGPLESGRYHSKYTDGRIGWRGFQARSQASLHSWKFNDMGDIEAFIQQGAPTFKIVEIPLSKGLLFRTRVRRDNPEGRSLLRNAYRPWYFKKRIEEIEGIGVERDLAGLPVLQAPEGMDLWNTENAEMVALKAVAEELVRSIRRDSEEGILLPSGWDLKLLSTGSSRQFDTNAIINRYDNRIAITMLSDIILIGAQASGSFALADVKKSLLASALEAQVKNIASTMNKFAVPRLFFYNDFNLTAMPEIVPGEVETPDIREVSLLLRAMGVDITKDMELLNFLRKISSMPQLDKATFDDIYLSQAELKDKQAEAALANKVSTKVPGQKLTAKESMEAHDNKANDSISSIENNIVQQNTDKYTGQ
jgi:hypothetical protein